jgi:hypothetical protein
MVGSYSPSEASFGEYYPERFKPFVIAPNSVIPVAHDLACSHGALEGINPEI